MGKADPRTLVLPARPLKGKRRAPQNHMLNSSKTVPEDLSVVSVEIGQETPGINAVLQRSHNTQLVLHLFQLHRQLTRAEIATRTGLTFQTVANILERLHK